MPRLGAGQRRFSLSNPTHRGESERGHSESVENFDQTVGLSIYDLDILSWFSHLLLSRLLFKPKTELNGDLEFFDFVFFNQPAHFGHFNPVGVNFATCACAQAPNALGACVVLDLKLNLTREGLPSTIRQV